MRFAFIQAEKATWPVAVMCAVLMVSTSGFYAWQRRAPSARDQKDERLKVRIGESFARSRRTYGSPRVHADLADERVGRNRIIRLMQAEGLEARVHRRHRSTTMSEHDQPVAANLLNREFEATAPNQRWVGDTTELLTPSGKFYLAAIVDLFARFFDYAARQKVGGTNLKYYVMKQLPVLPPSLLERQAPWASAEPIGEWITSRALELSYTSAEMAGFARDCGCDGPPFRWDAARRAVLRAELDAAFFHLYGLDRSDTEYILDTFPVLRDKELREHGEYRTRRLVLERYDALAAAIASGQPYQTPLSPPPASPLAAHPPLPAAS